MQFNDHQKDAIRQTLNTEGWLYVQELLERGIMELMDPATFKVDDKTNEMIVSDVKAAVQISTLFKGVMAKLHRIQNVPEQKKKEVLT